MNPGVAKSQNPKINPLFYIFPSGLFLWSNADAESGTRSSSRVTTEP